MKNKWLFVWYLTLLITGGIGYTMEKEYGVYAPSVIAPNASESLSSSTNHTGLSSLDSWDRKNRESIVQRLMFFVRLIDSEQYTPAIEEIVRHFVSFAHDAGALSDIQPRLYKEGFLDLLLEDFGDALQRAAPTLKRNEIEVSLVFLKHIVIQSCKTCDASCPRSAAKHKRENSY